MRATQRAGSIAEATAPATVRQARGPREVELCTADGSALVATLAVASDYRPRAGDEVLVTSGAGGAWVIGVLRALRPAARPSVRAADGASASVEEDGALRVRDGEGRLVFEHLPGENRSVVRVPRGDLELRADEGSIQLDAARGVHVRGGEDVCIRSDRRIRLEPPGEGHHLRMNRRGTALAAPELDVAAGLGKLSVGDGLLAARTLRTAVERGRHWIGTAEVRAGRVVERMRESYREVEDVAQVRAGRMRTVVRGLYSMLSERASLQAERDVSIDGEQIHLG